MWSEKGRRERRRRLREEERGEQNDDGKKRAGLWMVFFLGAAAIGNVFALRRRLLNIERQSTQGTSSRYRGEFGGSGQSDRWNQSKARSQARREERSAQEVQQQWQAHVDEQQRRERLRRMQEAFAREKGTHTNTTNTWHERYGDKWDWRWEGGRWEWKGEEQRQQAQREQDWQRNEERKHVSSYELLKRARLAHHFSVLGLDATRSEPYSDADIKAAFRSKAFEYHPDQNQGNKQKAEVEFRQLLESYHLLKGQLKLK